MSREQRSAHPPVACVVKPGDYHFSGMMSRHCGQWVPRYTCPSCGRQMRMAANYLGGGDLVCTGEKFLRPHQQSREIKFAIMKQAVDAADAITK